MELERQKEEEGAGRDREVRCVHIGGMLVRDVMCLLVHIGDTFLIIMTWSHYSLKLRS